MEQVTSVMKVIRGAAFARGPAGLRLCCRVLHSGRGCGNAGGSGAGSAPAAPTPGGFRGTGLVLAPARVAGWSCHPGLSAAGKGAGTRRRGWDAQLDRDAQSRRVRPLGLGGVLGVETRTLEPEGRHVQGARRGWAG